MAEREVKIGVASFIQADSSEGNGRLEPRWGFGLAGQVVDVHESDLERFDRFNGPVSAPAVPLPEVAPENDLAGEEPPRSGRGSGVDVWRDYAEKLGLLAEDDASRDDIVALVDASK
jgi:hypothetical protein